jgi:hypothetical protein
MNIKFSHRYKKLLNENNEVVKTATLLHVQIVNLEDLSPGFLCYDTDDGKYKLPSWGKYLMLIFLKPETENTGANLFTTLRRYTPEKYVYYCNGIGRTFDVVV